MEHMLTAYKMVRGNKTKNKLSLFTKILQTGLSVAASALLKLRLCHCFQTHSHPTNCWRETPPTPLQSKWGELRSTWDSNQPALLVRAQASPADPPLSKTALGVSQKDLIVLLGNTVSDCVYFRTRVSYFSKNPWYLFSKPKIRSFPYSKTFYFAQAAHQRHMTRQFSFYKILQFQFLG